jgi:hypothetical protein
MSDEKIDFSFLDPSRNTTRFDALVEDVVLRAFAARKGPATVSDQLLAWWRPALAAAAALAIIVWIAAMSPSGSRDRGARRESDGDAAFVQWALGERSSSAWEDVARAGGDDGSK